MRPLPKGANPGLQNPSRGRSKHVANEGQRLRDLALKLNNPSSTRIAELFAIANGNQDDASETERIQAVNELLDEYRSQLEKFADEKIERIDPLLLQGIKDWGLRIFAKRDPVLALGRLLGLRRPRGKRAKNTERDLQIAVAVLTKMKLGMSLEDAAAYVAENCRFGLGVESIAKIYNRNPSQSEELHFRRKGRKTAYLN